MRGPFGVPSRCSKLPGNPAGAVRSLIPGTNVPRAALSVVARTSPRRPNAIAPESPLGASRMRWYERRIAAGHSASSARRTQS